MIHPVLGDSATGERRQVLQARQRTGFGHHDRGVVQSTKFAQSRDGVDYSRAFLADQYVDTMNSLSALVDYRINGERTAAKPLVADDQLALTFTDRNQSVNDLIARVKRLVDGIARHDCG